MIKLSTGMRQGIAITGSLKALLDGGYLRIYSGTIPASADASIGSAVLLVEISDGGAGDLLHFEATAPGGVLSKAVGETWVGTTAVAGTPTFFRYVLDGDAGDASTSAVRFQGTAGALGNDMFIDSLPLTVSQPVSFPLFQIAIPEQ